MRVTFGYDIEMISIHAPLAGCDSRMMSSITSGMPFQSTHPLRGATLDALGIEYVRQISIHAPLAGCDVSG